MIRIKQLSAIIVFISLIALLTSCATEKKKTAIGAGVGAVAGAGVGAVIGHQSGHTAAGAAIGAAVGGAFGAFLRWLFSKG